MCGRFTLILEPDDIQEELNLDVDLSVDLKPRYNIAPTQPIAVIANTVPPKLEMFRWGLIPSWAKDPSIGSRMINARAESLAEKPSFRSAFARRRCLILADGFYEWKHPQGSQPARSAKGLATAHYFQLATKKLFAFAGLWETWTAPEGEKVPSCTIITCEANGLVGQYHDRMPVILNGDRLKGWLAPSTPNDLKAMLTPFPEDLMTVVQVSNLVNNPGYDSPQCIQPV